MKRLLTTVLLAVGCQAALPPAVLAGEHVVLAPSRMARGEEITRHVEKQVAARGRVLAVHSAVTQMRVRPGSGDTVQIEADLEFWSNDAEWMEQVGERFDVEIEESGSRIEVTVELPSQPKSSRKMKVHYEVDLNVTVPRGVALDISNKYGDVSVVDVDGPVNVNNNSGAIVVEGARDVVLDGRYGNIEATRIKGSLVAETSSGSVEAEDVAGDAKIESQYGNIRVEDVRGALEAKAKSGSVTVRRIKRHAVVGSTYANVDVEEVGQQLKVETSSGSVRVRDVGGDVEISTSYGDVEAEEIDGALVVVAKSSGAKVTNVRGPLKIEGSYGDVVVEAIDGPTEIATGSGSVTASAVKGDLFVQASHGSVRVKDVKGDLRVVAQSSSVSADGVSGGADVETSYAAVRLEDVGGAVTVQNQSGAVTVDGLRGDALRATHRIETSYADVDVTWPESSGLTFDLECTYGSLSTDLPGRVQNSGSRSSVQGSNGDGPARMTLVAKNGSVRLRTR